MLETDTILGMRQEKEIEKEIKAIQLPVSGFSRHSPLMYVSDIGNSTLSKKYRFLNL